MQLNPLSLKDKELFNRYLTLSIHELSVYSFENIYIWKGLFNIRWAIIKDSLLVFFQDKIGCFLYLPPLTKELTRDTLEKAFLSLDNFNSNKEISRIENVEAKDLKSYHDFGFSALEKSYDYLCCRDDLISLKGRGFKSFRASVNYFLKHYDFQFLPYDEKDKAACLKLYRLWAKERRAKSKDRLYQGMLLDSFNALRILLEDWRHLDCLGWVIKVGRQLKGFTFGFKLNQNTCSILYEITDLSVRGLARFIFREFCRNLQEFKSINVMDDLGLEHLRKVKLSYRPIKLIPAYLIKRK